MRRRRMTSEPGGNPRLAEDGPGAGARLAPQMNGHHGLGAVRVADRIAAGALGRRLPRRPQELEGAAVGTAAADRAGVAAGLTLSGPTGPPLLARGGAL